METTTHDEIRHDVIRDTELTMVAKSVKPDAKKRIVLPNAVVDEDFTYHIYYNRFGQIILDPQATIPAAELWLFKNKDILAMVDKGMDESANGILKDLGSFAKYAKDAP